MLDADPVVGELSHVEGGVGGMRLFGLLAGVGTRICGSATGVEVVELEVVLVGTGIIG
jgi:hypothetical protein